MHPNKTQLQHFEMIRNSSFNEFDGDQVVNSLLDHKELWQSAVMSDDVGFILRDLHLDFWHVDTLLILVTKGFEDKLEALANTWNADEVDWVEDSGQVLRMSSPETRKNKRMVLRVWWD